jgi:hypothetical protein
VPASHRRRAIAARCRLTGERKADVAPLIGRDDSHGLDECTDAQRRFRAQLALFLLNVAPASGWNTRKRFMATRRVWLAWAVLERFLPYPETLVVRTTSPEALRRALTSDRTDPVEGMPGLRYNHTDPPCFIHLPTQATLRIDTSRTSVPAPDTPPRGKAPGVRFAITRREQQLLDALLQMTVDAERLLGALLVRLPLADPDGIWTLSKGHLQNTAHEPDNLAANSPDINSHFLIGEGSSWHFRWDGPIGSFDIAAALTDTRTGLVEATAVLRPGHLLTVSYRAARLKLHGEV